jgi:hypothetical protein
MSKQINLNPSLDLGGLEFFKHTVSRSKCLLEYGSGGSTVYAVNIAKVKNIISIDTSKEWVEKVLKSTNLTETELLIEHCDVGPVGDWGVPINRDKSSDFWRYTTRPWQIAKNHNFVPDTILVDGRFRVASFLYSLLSARVGTIIMFDDYLDREHYFVVENFCKLSEKYGRMGVFYVDNFYSIPEITSAVAQYSTDWS